MGSNRGNYLLADLLEYRFPHVVERSYLLSLLQRTGAVPHYNEVCVCCVCVDVCACVCVCV